MYKLELLRTVKTLHCYKVPEIIALPIIKSSKAALLMALGDSNFSLCAKNIYR